MYLDTHKKEKELVKKKIITNERTRKKQPRFGGFFKIKKRPSIIARKTSFDLLPYKGTIGKKENFIVYKNKFVEILMLQGYNLEGISNDAKWDIVYSYETLMKLYVYPIKNITVHTPLETTSQQKYYAKLATKTKNPIQKRILMENYYEMKWFSENKLNKEFYVMLYGDTFQELKELKQDFLRYAGNLNFMPITLKKKKSIFYRLNNPTSKIFII